MLKRDLRELNIPESEIEEAQFEVFLSDSLQDLQDYALGRVTLEALGDRLRYHKAVAENWAVTKVVDTRHQNEGNDEIF